MEGLSNHGKSSTEIPTKENDEIAALKNQVEALKSELSHTKKKFDLWDDLIEEGFFIHENFVIKEVNKAIEKISGYKKEELIGKHGKMLLSDASFLKLQVYMTDPNSDSVELEFVRKDGQVLTILVRGVDLPGKKNNLRAVIVQNITLIKETQKQLQESRLKYKNLIDNSVFGIGIAFHEKILFANQALLDIFHVKSFKEFSSKRLTDYMPPDSKALVRERLKSYDGDNPPENVFRHDIIRPDGSFATLEVVSSEIIYDRKKCRQVFIKDITHELETEEALLRAASIFESIQIGLLIYRMENLDDDRSFRILTCNPAGAKFLKTEQEKLIGKYIDEAFPTLREDNYPQRYAEVVHSQTPVEIEDFFFADKDLVEGIFSVKLFPLPNQCLGISFEEVTSRRQMEKELQVRNEELNNLVHKVSHDLRAPLRSVKGLLYLSKLEENFEDHLPVIEERINRLDNFIRDILSHSRNLNTEIVYEKLDVEEIVKNCFVELEYLQDKVAIEKVISSSGCNYYGDKIRLSEICRNLTSNAIKYCDRRKEKQKVNVKIVVSPLKLKLTFEDNGIGIDQNYLDSIFNMFYRATDKEEGSGIGLYIVKQAVEKLNGHVKVKSKVGQGSTFTLEIPNMKSAVVA